MMTSFITETVVPASVIITAEEKGAKGRRMEKKYI